MTQARTEAERIEHLADELTRTQGCCLPEPGPLLVRR